MHDLVLRFLDDWNQRYLGEVEYSLLPEQMLSYAAKSGNN
jgi:hypothetical protein